MSLIAQVQCETSDEDDGTEWWMNGINIENSIGFLSFQSMELRGNQIDEIAYVLKH